jgi:hypothetical protein
MPALFHRCQQLINGRSLTTEDLGSRHPGVTLMVQGPPARFFVLSRRPDSTRRSPAYIIWPWDGDDDATITRHTAALSPPFTEAITTGIPVPRNGSLLGLLAGREVAGFLVFYTSEQHDPGRPVQSTMIHADLPERLWPRTANRDFGPWFWESYRDGSIVELNTLITATPGTFFWIDGGTPSSRYIVVNRDVPAQAGFVVPAGRYAWCGALQEGHRPPPASQLLTTRGRADMAGLA